MSLTEMVPGGPGGPAGPEVPSYPGPEPERGNVSRRFAPVLDKLQLSNIHIFTSLHNVSYSGCRPELGWPNPPPACPLHSLWPQVDREDQQVQPGTGGCRLLRVKTMSSHSLDHNNNT